MQNLNLANVKNGMVLTQDIFASEDSTSPIVREGTVVTTRLLQRLKNYHIDMIPVREADEEPTVQTEALESSIEPPSIGTFLRDEAIDNLEDFFSSASIKEEDIHHSSARLVEQMDDVVGQLVDSLLGNRTALVNITNLRSYDDYTYHHSLSVAVLSIAIGQNVGLNSEELNSLGMAAIMHDIGKTAIPLDILRKPARLTDDEFVIMKSHSAEGFDYLVTYAIGDEDIRSGVLYHHEKMDGTGYPHGLAGEDIPIWSRIISVADVYDALTSNRPYREPMQPADAVEYIMGGIGSAFDYDIAKALVKKVDLYPLGSTLELSNGDFATVLDNENPMRPVVKLIDTGEILDLYNNRKCLSIVITRIVPNVPVQPLTKTPL